MDCFASLERIAVIFWGSYSSFYKQGNWRFERSVISFHFFFFLTMSWCVCSMPCYGFSFITKITISLGMLLAANHRKIDECWLKSEFIVLISRCLETASGWHWFIFSVGSSKFQAFPVLLLYHPWHVGFSHPLMMATRLPWPNALWHSKAKTGRWWVGWPDLRSLISKAVCPISEQNGESVG